MILLIKDNKKAIKLSKKYQVPCELTSFFAAEKLIDPIKNTRKYKQYEYKVKPDSSDDFSSAGLLKIKMVTGTEYLMCFEQHYTIEYVKTKIKEKLGIPEDQQRLIHEGRQLDDYQTLSDYGIKRGSTLRVIPRLRGGGLKSELRKIRMINLVRGGTSFADIWYKEEKVSDMLGKVSWRADEITPGLKLFYKGKQITGYDETLHECNVPENSIIEYSYLSDKDFIKTQHADGYWKEELLDDIEFTLDDIIQAINKKVKNKVSGKKKQVRVVLTWLGIKILEKYQKTKDEWILIAKKGKLFLESCGLNYEDLSFPSLDLSEFGTYKK